MKHRFYFSFIYFYFTECTKICGLIQTRQHVNAHYAWKHLCGTLCQSHKSILIPDYIDRGFANLRKTDKNHQALE